MNQPKKIKLIEKKGAIRSVIWTIIILLIPLVLTLINPNSSIRGGKGGGWDWGPLDFLIMGLLIFGTGLALDFAWRFLRNPVHRIIACVIIVGMLLLVWVELAVDGVSRFVKMILG